MLDLSKNFLVLSEMLNTRFSHDMTGPINAVNNGIDLLLETEDPDMRKQAISLLKMSSQDSMARLQAYRIAFGRVEEGIELDLSEIKDISEKFFASGKISMDWKKSSVKKIDSRARQILMNTILLLASLLIYSGRIEIDVNENKNISIKASAEKIKKDDNVAKILAGETANMEITPYNVQIFLVRALSEIHHYQLQTNIAPAAFEVVIQKSL